jgi:hypothetical protein
MEGGYRAPAPFLQLSNIGDYTNKDDLGTLVSSSIFTLFLSLVAARVGNLGGVTMNVYFDMFGLEGLLSNTMLMVILLHVARYLYSTLYSTGRAWSPFVFLCIVAVVQALYDLFFYYGVINVVPTGVNQMVDILKQYAKDYNVKAMAGHIVLLTTTALVAMFMNDMYDMHKFFLSAVVLYLAPYFLSVVVRKPKAPTPPAAPPKESMKDYRGY